MTPSLADRLARRLQALQAAYGSTGVVALSCDGAPEPVATMTGAKASDVDAFVRRETRSRTTGYVEVFFLASGASITHPCEGSKRRRMSAEERWERRYG